MKKQKLIKIGATVIWLALLALLAVFQMPYQVNTIKLVCQSDTPLHAEQFLFRYDSGDGFGYDSGDGFVSGGGALPVCQTDTDLIVQDSEGRFSLPLTVNLNHERPNRIRFDNCAGAYELTLTAVEFYQGDKLLYTLSGAELSEQFTASGSLSAEATDEGLRLVAADASGEAEDGFLTSAEDFDRFLGARTCHYSAHTFVMAAVYTLIWAGVLFGSRLVKKVER